MVDSETALQLLEISAVYGAASLQESLVDLLFGGLWYHLCYHGAAFLP